MKCEKLDSFERLLQKLLSLVLMVDDGLDFETRLDCFHLEIKSRLNDQVLMMYINHTIVILVIRRFFMY